MISASLRINRWPGIKHSMVATVNSCESCLEIPLLVRATSTDTQNNSMDHLPFTETPELKHVPSLPIFGSMLTWHSGIPGNSFSQPYNFWPEMNKRYGGFYRIGLPGGGRRDDIRRTAYVITDPREVVKVIRNTGQFPSGILEAFWVNIKWMKSRGFASLGLFKRGEEWERLRTFLQTDMLHPDSARGFVPGILEAAYLASKGAQAASDDMNLYLQRCAFDMFASAMLGELTQVADSTTATDPENERFVSSSSQGLGLATSMVFDPKENILGNIFGVETEKCKKAFEGFDEAWAIGQAKFARFMQIRKEGKLNDVQKKSYLCRALDRQEAEGSNVSIKEVQELTWLGLFAAVDTTSTVLRWNAIHLARLPDVQERLYLELVTAVEMYGENGRLTAEVLDKKHTPYLHAVVRESTRLTPLIPIFINKTIQADNPVPVHKEFLHTGDVVLMEVMSTFHNPLIVDDPDEFRPERWFPDQVERRKGTYREIIDHPFLKEPFSQGARKCPGSRIAINEIHIMIAQLVLDWNFVIHADHKPRILSWKDIPYQRLTAIEPQLPPFHLTPRRKSII